MQLLNDREIAALCEGSSGMISPFVPKQQSEGIISYGVSSFGYDIRAGYTWKVFTNLRTTIVDPKVPNEDSFFTWECMEGETIIIPPNSYALTVSIERFKMPNNVEAICLGKSTYARVAISVNATPLEPGWEGYLTIEIANNSPCPVRMYPGEGIAQLLFIRGNTPDTTYADRSGKYQGQTNKPITARIKKTKP